MSWKKSLVVTFKLLRLFVNTLTADDKHSFLSRDNSIQTIQMHLSQKQKTFSEFFFAFLKSTSNCGNFRKKMTLIAYKFLNLRTRRMCLDKCLKSPVWDDPLKGNMVNGPKHWFKLNGSFFTLSVDHWERKWVRKSHSWWHPKS